MSSEQIIHIPVNKRRIAGAKYFIHEEKLKRNPNQSSSSDNEIKYIKIKTKGSTTISQSCEMLRSTTITQSCDMLINKGTLPSNNNIKIRNCIVNNETKSKEQQTSNFEKNTVMPPPGRKARKRKRKRKASKNNEFQDWFLPGTYTEDFLSNDIPNKTTKIRRMSPSLSPATTGSLTQSIFQYKNFETKNKKVRTPQVVPFSLSDDSIIVSLEKVTNNLPLLSNSKNTVSLVDKNSTVLSNSSTENKSNKTILISSGCSSNVNNVLHVDSDVPVLNSSETTVTLTKTNKIIECEESSSLNVKILPIGLKEDASSQPVTAENLISETECGKLKTGSVHISMPIAPSELEKNPVMPPPGTYACKRKRKRTLEITESQDCFGPGTYAEDFLSNDIPNKTKKLRRISPSLSPASTGSLTQSVFQYKNCETNDTKAKTLQVIPFSLSDDSSSVSLEKINDNLPVMNNSKEMISFGNNSSSIQFNRSTEDKTNKTILISSSCSSNVNNVLNIESNVPVVKPCETIVTLTKDITSSDSEENSSHSGDILPMELKRYAVSQPVLTKSFMSEAKSGKLNTSAVHSSLPIPLIDIADTSDTSEENPDTNSNYLKSSPSILENYCTATEFTFEDGVPKARSTTANLSNGIINGKEKLNFDEILQNQESEHKISGRNCQHVTDSGQVSESASFQKITYEESESHYVTLQNHDVTIKTSSTKDFTTPMKGSEIVLDSDDDVTLLSSKQTNLNLHQEISLHNNDEEKDILGVTFSPVYSSTQQSSSQSSNSKSSEEFLSEESKICLGGIVKMMARHYSIPLTDCVYILETNSFNILTTMQELQLKKYSSSESSN
ncbi:UNVERIFIED_CONTAM: hypothetical protein RMT77_014716 [Armadillidium vulgare]